MERSILFVKNTEQYTALDSKPCIAQVGKKPQIKTVIGLAVVCRMRQRGGEEASGRIFLLNVIRWLSATRQVEPDMAE